MDFGRCSKFINAQVIISQTGLIVMIILVVMTTNSV